MPGAVFLRNERVELRTIEEETALSVQSFVGFSTTVVSPVVFGAALDFGGFALAFPTLAAGALVALGALATLRYTGDRRLDESESGV